MDSTRRMCGSGVLAFKDFAVIVARRQCPGRHDLGDGAEPEHHGVLQLLHVLDAGRHVPQGIHDLRMEMKAAGDEDYMR